jgi:hypothetical protein
MRGLTAVNTLLQLADPLAPDTATRIPGLTDGASFPWVPVLLLGVPAGIALVLLWLYVRTARQHRRAMLAPPVWLLPYLEQAETGGGRSPPVPDPDHLALEEERLASAASLARRKRVLLMALGLNFIAAWAGAGVYLWGASRMVEFSELPATLGVGPSVDTLAFRGLEGRGEEMPNRDDAAPAVSPVAAPVDPEALRLRRERQAAFLRRRDSLLEVQRLDSIRLAEAIAQRVRDSIAQVVLDSLARAVAQAAPPVPPAPPAPPPPPARDPDADRARAGAVVARAAEQLVAAVNQRAGLSGLLAAGSRRDRFLQFVEEHGPTATLGGVGEPVVSGDGFEAVVTIQFQWRGPFGDTRRRPGRFQVAGQAGGETWRVTGIVPLDNLP